MRTKSITRNHSRHALSPETISGHRALQTKRPERHQKLLLVIQVVQANALTETATSYDQKLKAYDQKPRPLKGARGFWSLVVAVRFWWSWEWASALQKQPGEQGNETLGKMSKRKGAAGELDSDRKLNEVLGTAFHRGRQYHGGPESPDLAGFVEGLLKLPPALRDVVAMRYAGMKYARIAEVQGVTMACVEKRHRLAMKQWPVLRELFPVKASKQWRRKPHHKSAAFGNKQGVTGPNCCKTVRKQGASASRIRRGRRL
jgi:hypothetical protein